MDNLLYDFLTGIGYGHALHPVLTHLVIGPVIAAFLLGLLGALAKKPLFMRTARHMVGFALVFWFFTVGIGVLDWVHFYGSATDLPPIKIKFIGAGVLFLLLVATLVLNRRLPENSKWPLIPYFLMVLCVIVIGYEGAELAAGN